MVNRFKENTKYSHEDYISFKLFPNETAIKLTFGANKKPPVIEYNIYDGGAITNRYQFEEYQGERIIKTLFVIKRGTSEELEKLNPVLRAGEPAADITKNILKIGDGVRPWNELPLSTGFDDVIILSGGDSEFPV